jgi:hypothetical protein
MEMADSNVIELHRWLGKEAPNRRAFLDGDRASGDECLRMIRAFARVREPSLRKLLMRSVEAASQPDSDDPLSLERFPD